MFTWLKKIYKRKKNNPPNEPAPLNKETASRDPNPKAEKLPAEQTEIKETEVVEKITEKSAICKEADLKPEHHVFISKLARKYNPLDSAGDKGLKSLVSKKIQPGNTVKKRLAWKKITAVALISIVFCGVFYVAIQAGFKRFEETAHRENELLISATREIISQEVQPLKEQKIRDEEEAATKQEAEKKENSPNANVQEKDIWDRLLEEQLAAEYNQDTEEFQPDQIALKVLNRGATIESAGKVKKILINKGYSKTSAKDGPKPDVIENAVFFKDDKFMKEAQAIAQLLREKENIHSYARKASTEEEKSEDIVIVLGTLKEWPPE